MLMLKACLERRWVEEHGAIMETPDPLPPGKYKVVWLNDDNPRRPHCPPGGGGGSSCAGADGYTVPLIVGPDLSWSIGASTTQDNSMNPQIPVHDRMFKSQSKCLWTRWWSDLALSDPHALPHGRVHSSDKTTRRMHAPQSPGG
jgi:hypothetical protein